MLVISINIQVHRLKLQHPSGIALKTPALLRHLREYLFIFIYPKIAVAIKFHLINAVKGFKRHSLYLQLVPFVNHIILL